MERELWNEIYQLAISCDRSKTNLFYRDWQIVVIYFWAVLHDRPTCWACDRRNWNADQLVMLPNQSTLSRRLRSQEVQDLINEVYQLVAQLSLSSKYLCIDGMPLTVRDHSKDPDAKNGWASRGFAKGFKLHAIWGNGAIPVAFEVEPMNMAEPTVARKLVKLMPQHSWLIGDKAYDSNPLHDAVSAKQCQLIAAQKRKGKKLGCRKHSPYRLKCFGILKTDLGKLLLQYRERIERNFSRLICTGIGLNHHLPAWVRRIHRVRLWVQAKLITNALLWIYNKKRTMQAHA